ncbi:Membrane protein-like protein [uncultured Desulfovibrio sp.]|uniref:Membrane protein-like protein n=2 Tax=Desulfovibrio TaxID=872 RepID=A0A212LBV3_9BACT|nr:Membrane protein-like protein [uncultured Desulfovibrio sp.]VZH35087.1 Membrane protein-like protein [Desulfovibrio sp. 86]
MNKTDASSCSDMNIQSPEHASSSKDSFPPLSRSSLSLLCDSGRISPSAWSQALDFCGFRPDGKAWLTYWRQVFLLGGVLFFLAGIICFIAWNWDDMQPFARMTLVGVIVASTGIGAVAVGPDSRSGQALLLACGVAMGPLLAVFGQTYQTGAELWELFRVWTVLLVALALAGRQTGLWFAAWLSGNVFIALWLGRNLTSPFDAFSQLFAIPEWLVAIACAIFLWEWAAQRAVRKGAQNWLRSRWFPRLLFLDLAARTSCYLIEGILGSYRWADTWQLWLPHQVVPYFAVALAGLAWWWYRKKEPDLFMLATLLGAVAAVLLAVLAEAELFFDLGVVAAFLFWGLLVTGLTAGLAKMLLHLQKAMSAEENEKHAPMVSLPSFFGRARSGVSWQLLWENLQAHGEALRDEPAPDVKEPYSPWYIKLLLALGGWLAAVLFMCFLGLLLFETLNISSHEELTIFIVSVPVLLLGRTMLAGGKLFSRHFGFALAIAGTSGIAIALFLGLDSVMTACFVLAALLAAISVFMRNVAYTFLSAIGIVGCVAQGISSLIYASVRHGFADSAMLDMALLLPPVWWVLLSLGLACFCLQEKRWRGSMRGQTADAWFFGAYTGMLMIQIWSLGLSYGLRAILDLPLWGSGGMGLGAAAGVTVLILFLTKKHSLTARVAGMASVPLLFALGWYLPGATLALLGLVMARQMGNAVMQGAVLVYFFAYMIFYYYNLAMPFSAKSTYLVTSGLVLLLLALVLRVWQTKSSIEEAGRA